MIAFIPLKSWRSRLPLLGMTPELPQDKDSQPINLPFGKPQIMAPWTIQVTNWPPAWESLDLIYKNIQLLNSVSSFKSLMASALAGEGKSTLALGLALSAARLHQRVLLIDADLRRPICINSSISLMSRGFQLY